jgi:hypothetical protein
MLLPSHAIVYASGRFSVWGIQNEVRAGKRSENISCHSCTRLYLYLCNIYVYRTTILYLIRVVLKEHIFKEILVRRIICV